MKRLAFSLLFVLIAGFHALSAERDFTLSDRVDWALADIVKELSAGVSGPAALIPRLEKLAEAAPDNDAVFYYLATCQARASKAREAEANFRKAISLDSTNFKYKESLAVLYSAAGRNDLAAAIYVELLKKDPKHYRNAFALTALGDSQFACRQDSLALESYDAALLYEPGYVPALLGKSEIFRMRGNFPAFFVTIGEFASDRNVEPGPKCEYVTRLLQRVDGRFYYSWHEQLDSLVSTVLNAHPEDSSALKLNGRWFIGTGQKEKGDACFAKVLALYPDDIDARYYKIQTLSEGDDRKALIRECEAFLKKTPEYVPVLNDYAYFLSLEGKKLRKAEKMSRTALEAEPENPAYLDTYGWILHLMGRNEEAKAHFKKALIYGGKSHKEILLHYSEVLKALGEKDLSNYYKALGEAHK